MKTRRIFYIYSQRFKPYLTETEKKPFTYIGLTLFSLSFFSAFAIRPALIAITDLRHQIELTREIDADLQTKLRNISRARPIYERIEEDIPLIEEALPREKPLSNLINSLNAHASTAGVSISSLRISSKGELVKGRNLTINSLSMQILGDFPAIVNFVKNLENSRRQFSVESIQIRSLSRKGEGEGLLSGAMTVETYSLGKEVDEEMERLED